MIMEQPISLNALPGRPLLEHVPLAGVEALDPDFELTFWRFRLLMEAEDDTDYIRKELMLLYSWSEQYELYAKMDEEKAYDQSVQKAIWERWQTLGE